MTPSDLYAYGAALAGRPQWQAWLARFLGPIHPGGPRSAIDDSLVRKWSRGARPVPEWAANTIRAEAAIFLPPDEWIERGPYIVRLWWPRIVLELVSDARGLALSGHMAAALVSLPDGRDVALWHCDDMGHLDKLLLRLRGEEARKVKRL